MRMDVTMTGNIRANIESDRREPSTAFRKYVLVGGGNHRFGHYHYNGFENSTDNDADHPFHSFIRCSDGRTDD